jgi:hypothetical protein
MLVFWLSICYSFLCFLALSFLFFTFFLSISLVDFSTSYYLFYSIYFLALFNYLFLQNVLTFYIKFIINRIIIIATLTNKLKIVRHIIIHPNDHFTSESVTKSVNINKILELIKMITSLNISILFANFVLNGLY